MKYIVLLLLLTGCSQVFYPKVQIDPRFHSHLETYLNYKEEYTGNRKLRKMSIVLKDLDSDYIGYCTYYLTGRRTITIDKTFWEQSNMVDRDLLLFHELGHCDLNLDHSEPKSIMEEHHIGAYRFLSNPEYYMQELFQIIPTNSFDQGYAMSYPGTGGLHGKRINSSCRSYRLW